MLPAGLVLGRDGTAVMTPAAYGVTPAAPAQPLVYCYSPTAGAAPAADIQLSAASLSYHQQLQQQQQQQRQQMLLTAKSLQQQAAQQMYVQTGLGLQPYQLPAASTLTPVGLHGPLALTPNLPYLSPDQVYLPASVASAAGVTSTNIAMPSGRKVSCVSVTDCSSWMLNDIDSSQNLHSM